MLVTVFITFVVLTTCYVALLWIGLRRVTKHLQGNHEATEAVVKHVLIPLLGRKPEVPVQEEGEEEESSNSVPTLKKGRD